MNEKIARALELIREAHEEHGLDTDDVHIRVSRRAFDSLVQPPPEKDLYFTHCRMGSGITIWPMGGPR